MRSMTRSEFQALPVVDAGIRQQWNRLQACLAPFRRWLLEKEEPCDYTRDEWLSSWGPYPEPRIGWRDRPHSGCTHSLAVDFSTMLATITIRSTGGTVWTHHARLVGRELGMHSNFLVLEDLDSDGDPVRRSMIRHA